MSRERKKNLTIKINQLCTVFPAYCVGVINIDRTRKQPWYCLLTVLFKIITIHRKVTLGETSEVKKKKKKLGRRTKLVTFSRLLYDDYMLPARTGRRM